MKIALELVQWRKHKGLSQSKAALVLGVPVKTLQNWEQGVRTPRGLAIDKLRELIAG